MPVSLMVIFAAVAACCSQVYAVPIPIASPAPIVQFQPDINGQAVTLALSVSPQPSNHQINFTSADVARVKHANKIASDLVTVVLKKMGIRLGGVSLLTITECSPECYPCYVFPRPWTCPRMHAGQALVLLEQDLQLLRTLKPVLTGVIEFEEAYGSTNDSNTTTPSNGTISPSNGTISTSNGTISPSNGTISPSNGTISPSNGTSSSSNGTSTPSNATTSPSTTPSNGTTSSSNATATSFTTNTAMNEFIRIVLLDFQASYNDLIKTLQQTFHFSHPEESSGDYTLSGTVNSINAEDSTSCTERQSDTLYHQYVNVYETRQALQQTTWDINCLEGLLSQQE